jgi:hypothetical protein
VSGIENPLARAGATSLVAIMVAGSLFLWVGVPLIWLWIGSQLQDSAGISTALAVTFFGAVGSILALAVGLGWVNHRHQALKEGETGRRQDHGVLGQILAVTAGIAVAIFSVWFIIFAGPGPSIKISG